MYTKTRGGNCGGLRTRLCSAVSLSVGVPLPGFITFHLHACYNSKYFYSNLFSKKSNKNDRNEPDDVTLHVFDNSLLNQ